MLPSDSQVPTTGCPARSACLTRLVRMKGFSWPRRHYRESGSPARLFAAGFSGCRGSPARDNAFRSRRPPEAPPMDVDIAAIDRDVKQLRGRLDPLFAELQKVI